MGFTNSPPRGSSGIPPCYSWDPGTWPLSTSLAECELMWRRAWFPAQTLEHAVSGLGSRHAKHLPEHRGLMGLAFQQCEQHAEGNAGGAGVSADSEPGPVSLVPSEARRGELQLLGKGKGAHGKLRRKQPCSHRQESPARFKMGREGWELVGENSLMPPQNPQVFSSRVHTSRETSPGPAWEREGGCTGYHQRLHAQLGWWW